MLTTVRRFATRVLLWHLVLLAIVVTVVILAAHSVYTSAREQATQQSAARLVLLANQTSRAIQSHYESIISDLELILWDESDTAATQASAGGPAGIGGPIGVGDRGPGDRNDRGGGPGGDFGGPRDRSREGNPDFRIDATPGLPPNISTAPSTPAVIRIENGIARPDNGQPNSLQRREGFIFRPAATTRPRFDRLRAFSDQKTVPIDPILTNIMWRQLRDRVSNLIVIDNQTGKVVTSFPNTPEGTGFGDEIAAKEIEWLRSLKEASMSHFARLNDKTMDGFHLLAVPAIGRIGNARVPQSVVAVVPISSIKERFFDPLNKEGVVTGALLDSTGTILVAIDSRIAGINLLQQVDPHARTQLEPFIVGGQSGWFSIPYSTTMTNGNAVQSRVLPPRVLAFAQVADLPGRRWIVLTSAQLADVENLVDGVFKEATMWAIFLTLSVAGIMVSTSVFMIRSRGQLERARHQLLTRELEQARRIQLAWLPDMKQKVEGVSVFAANLPASHISGDFYNWFELRAEGDIDGTLPRIAVVIGDVTGHGMSAAFLMATTQLLVRTTLQRDNDPGRCLCEVNRQLCTQGFQGQFVTMLVMVLDPNTGELKIATAGHPAPLMQQDGKFISMNVESQLVLGVSADEVYETASITVDARTSFLLYTDGVIEAEAPDRQQYGLKRLMQTLSYIQPAVLTPEACIQDVLADVDRFTNQQDLHDDVTLVALQMQQVPFALPA